MGWINDVGKSLDRSMIHLEASGVTHRRHPYSYRTIPHFTVAWPIRYPPPLPSPRHLRAPRASAAPAASDRRSPPTRVSRPPAHADPPALPPWCSPQSTLLTSSHCWILPVTMTSYCKAKIICKMTRGSSIVGCTWVLPSARAAASSAYGTLAPAPMVVGGSGEDAT